MDKIAFVFSGQGDQYPGMGKKLYETNPIARRVYDFCDGIRPGTLQQCWEGTEEELKETKNTQPCLFATELAAANVLLEMGVSPDAAVGFSMGEVAAAVISGLFDLETGFRLVCKRGELMQQEAEQFDTFMAAVLKLKPEQVEELCGKRKACYPVNFNCPGQITVSGLASELPQFLADVRAQGGRVIPLKVNGAFHSPFMNAAAAAFATELERAEQKPKCLELYSGMTAKPYTGNVVQLLSEQISHPVQWEKTIRQMIADGINLFIEIGPGKTLTNLISKISTDVKAVSVWTYLEERE